MPFLYDRKFGIAPGLGHPCQRLRALSQTRSDSKTKLVVTQAIPEN